MNSFSSGDLILTIRGKLPKINILGRYRETPNDKRHAANGNFANQSLWVVLEAAKHGELTIVRYGAVAKNVMKEVEVSLA